VRITAVLQASVPEVGITSEILLRAMPTARERSARLE
jgi:hypothetical protein